MDVYFRTDINIAAMILCGIVITIANKRLDHKDQLNRVFLLTGLIVIFELMTETITCMLNRRPEAWIDSVSTLLHILLFAAAPVLTYFWYLMICHWIIPIEKIIRRKQAVLLIPVAVNLVLTLLSPIYGWVFYIDDANVYHRGSYFLISVGITYFYLLYAFLLVIRQRKKIVREEYIPLMIFGILPMLGGLLQTLFYGILLMWSTAGFSLMIVYIFLQQRMIHLDDLTGAWTRGTFEYCIAQKVDQKRRDEFGLIFVDIDELKRINDQYGHFEGDYALRTTVQLIKSALRKTDIIARTGGDEFLVILDCISREKIDHTIERIRNTFRQYNETSNKEYVLDCSIGAELFHSDFHDINEFMRHVDKLMYENKKTKKQGV